MVWNISSHRHNRNHHSISRDSNHSNSSNHFFLLSFLLSFLFFLPPFLFFLLFLSFSHLITPPQVPDGVIDFSHNQVPVAPSFTFPPTKLNLAKNSLTQQQISDYRENGFVSGHLSLAPVSSLFFKAFLCLVITNAMSFCETMKYSLFDLILSSF